MSKVLIQSSGNFNFQTIQAELLIREAFELIGMSGSMVVAEQLEGAARSINFLLSDLVNRNVNLWTMKKLFLPLVPQQSSYILPSTLIKVTQIEMRTSNRDLSGTPQSSSGIAANAFDDNENTSCSQTASNGSIGFNFSSPQIISFIGIQSMTTQNYTIKFQASNDNQTWTDLLILPLANYNAGTTVWYSVLDINGNPYNTYYNYYQILETGNSTLNIAELYFNDQIVDYPLTEISNYDYLRMPIKSTQGRPTIYSVDYQITPILNIWQVPPLQSQDEYNCLIVAYQSMLETLNTYTESINIPNAFYQAVVYGLAKSLAMKYAPDKLQFISPEYDRALDICLTRNTNTLPLKFSINVN